MARNFLRIYFRGIKKIWTVLWKKKSKEKYKICGRKEKRKTGGAEKNSEKSITKRNKT